jgi:hypothetical protein
MTVTVHQILFALVLSVKDVILQVAQVVKASYMMIASSFQVFLISVKIVLKA